MKLKHYIVFYSIIIIIILLCCIILFFNSRVDDVHLKKENEISETVTESLDSTTFENDTASGPITYTPPQEAQQPANQEYFSGWDGSNPEFVAAIKNRMNDPDSFEHIETTYNDKGDYLEIKMKYRGKNSYNATIRNINICNFDKSTRTVTAID
ncbi:hypothetical protein [Pedobacter cryoconitis]|uniref:Uncharacterized protein n=1 Tax=Pedobacter cryoconitis TaxID=188932 RepID=A0A327T712_9SPHI|nr:hypothetical protein [Pedobacter cryoconitis]RAJ37390.1 hypothetical protein LY11_00467 [Pedobacter cryoconitis]